jgi:glycosyltransferase involved in cell wall biosynthesis
MRLLLLTKRYYMTKDIILEEYGRQYELAVQLARLGWDIKALCLNYRSAWGMEVIHRGGIEWRSYSALSSWPLWYRHAVREIKAWNPGVIMGCSDPLHIIAAYLARPDDTPLAVDLHDNLECKGMMKFPGFERYVDKAIDSANLVTCVSEPLRQKIAAEYDPPGVVTLLENAIPEHFQNVDETKDSSRRKYDLDGADKIIGVAGSLYRSRGMETILTGFGLLREKNPALVLALAGPTDLKTKAFEREGIRYFGNLDWKSVPSFMNTFDVGIVPNIQPLFADYCFPQKAVELCALSIPLVAADFGVMKSMAAGSAQVLYRADDPGDFARAVLFQLDHRMHLPVSVRNWAQQGKSLHRNLLQISSDKH